jgi:hypothetical protein
VNAKTIDDGGKRTQYYYDDKVFHKGSNLGKD